jgi:hypothetical protein
MQCPVCHEENWSEGIIKDNTSLARIPLYFTPKWRKFWLFSSTPLTAWACKNCGNVLLNADPKQLAKTTQD